MTEKEIKIINKLLDRKFEKLRTELKEVVTGLIVMINEQKQSTSNLFNNKLLNSLQTNSTTANVDDIQMFNNIMEQKGNGSKLDFLKNVLNTEIEDENTIPSAAVENLIDKFISK